MRRAHYVSRCCFLRALHDPNHSSLIRPREKRDWTMASASTTRPLCTRCSPLFTRAWFELETEAAAIRGGAQSEGQCRIRTTRHDIILTQKNESCSESSTRGMSLGDGCIGESSSPFLILQRAASRRRSCSQCSGFKAASGFLARARSGPSLRPARPVRSGMPAG